MGMSIWLNIRDGENFKSNEEDHSAVLYLQEPLDALAAVLKVAPLSTFYDDTDLRYNMDESDEFEISEDGWSASDAKWFSALEVQNTVLAILNHLQANEAILLESDGWSQAEVIEDLQDFESELKQAVENSKMVHLCIVA